MKELKENGEKVGISDVMVQTYNPRMQEDESG